MQTKRRRLVAETADDLQQILFGDMEEDIVPEGQESTPEQQAVVPIAVPEPEDIEVFSDSDRDSMDEFIVRDTHDDREHRFIQSYSDRYGEDVAESLNDVITIFGDLRILDIYSRGETTKLKRIIPELKGHALASQYDPEEVAAHYATSQDETILTTDCSERMQEEFGTAKCLETLAVFDEGIASESLEAEWAIEARWIYSVLREQSKTKDKSSSDWVMWNTLKLADPEAVVADPIPSEHTCVPKEDYKEDVIRRIHVALRDIKGRGFDPLYIWHSMTKAKYYWYINLEDLQSIQTLDASEWPKLWVKYEAIDAKLSALMEELDSFMSTVELTEEPSTQFLLADNAKKDATSLVAELRTAVSEEGMSRNLSEVLDDITLSISAELEPVVRFVSVSAALVVSSPPKSPKGRAPRKTTAAVGGGSSSLVVATVIASKLNEALIPLLVLSPREVGENLSIGAKIHKGPFSGRMASPVVDASVVKSAAVRLALTELLTSTLASNVKVRRWFRQELYARATVCTHPTTASVSAYKRLYNVRRLCMRPVSDFFGTEAFLAIHSLVSLAELEVDIVVSNDGRIVVEGVHEMSDSLVKSLDSRILHGQREEAFLADDSEAVSEQLVRSAALLKEHSETRNLRNISRVSDLLSEDPLLNDLLYHMTPDTNQGCEESWLRDLRIAIAKSVIARLYKSIKAEIHNRLLKDAYAVASRSCAESFSQIVRMKPFDPRPLKVWYGSQETDLKTLVNECSDQRIVREYIRRRMGDFSVLSVVLEKLVNGFRTHCVVVNHRGEFAEAIALDALMSSGTAYERKQADQDRITALVKSHFPSLVVIGVDDRKAKSAFMEIKKILGNIEYDREWEANKYLGSAQIAFGDMTIPSRVAKLETGWELSLPIRLAASLGRFQQSPIAETLSLKASILTVPLHSLQSFVPRDLLLRSLDQTASRIVTLLGVDVNDCVTSASRRSLLEYVPGLGPRKARHLTQAVDAFARGLDGTGHKDTRPDRLESILGARVYRNAQPFLKLVPDSDRVAAVVIEEYAGGTRRYRRRQRSDSMSSVSSSASSSSSDSSSSSYSSMSSSQSDVEEPMVDEQPETQQDERYKDDNGEWKKRESKATEVSTEKEMWYEDDNGEWHKRVDIQDQSTEEWYKDKNGEWKKQESNQAATNTGKEEWFKDADGKWHKKTSEPVLARKSIEFSYFGIPNSLIPTILEGYSPLEICRFSRDCWAVAIEVLSMAGQSTHFAWQSLGDAHAYSSVKSMNFSGLLDAMFDSSNLPAHLCDPEIDISATKAGARNLVTQLVVDQLESPFVTSIRYAWKEPSKQKIFFACIRESDAGFNKWTPVTCTITEVSDKWTIKAMELSTGLDGILTQGYDDYKTRYHVGDSVRGRISDFDFNKFSLSFTTQTIKEDEIASILKGQDYLVVRDSDFADLTTLGKVQVAPEMDASRTLVKTRRIIKHESFFEIPHGAAVEKLVNAPIGDVIFRPSSSQPGQYMGMIKIMGPAESRDPSREDWIKVFRFTEAPSSRTVSKGPSGARKTVFKLVETNEEFDEFDQMKVLYVDKYLRLLRELRSHPKFKAGGIEQVKNTIMVRFKLAGKDMAPQDTVQYVLAQDDRREGAGNAVLIWAARGDKVYEDPIEITNKGFKYWTKGPYASITALLNWWKQGGYKERPLLMQVYRNQRTHK